MPGTNKAPEALRQAGLIHRLTAMGGREAGIVLPGRYVDDDATRPAGRVRNQEAMVDHARRLASSVEDILEAGDTPLVIGGDCSLLLGGWASSLETGSRRVGPRRWAHRLSSPRQ
ncbi:arginase family protein [Nesterenkonia halotolerans]|uniref:arginase family protein n=1 Tax=Nesterenkonia halotolerans TaxID=225325 RepID=UPI003630D3AB